MTLLTGFSGRLDSEALQNPKVWVPILGEAQDIRLQRILTDFSQTRFVLSFPSRPESPGAVTEFIESPSAHSI